MKLSVVVRIMVCCMVTTMPQIHAETNDIPATKRENAETPRDTTATGTMQSTTTPTTTNSTTTVTSAPTSHLYRTTTSTTPTPLEQLWPCNFTKDKIGSNNNQAAAEKFLELYNEQAEFYRYHVMLADWTANTNISDENDKKKVQQELELADFDKKAQRCALVFNASAMDTNVTRLLTKIKDIGTSAMKDPKKLKELKDILASMESTYSQATVCPHLEDPASCLPMDPDITLKMQQSRNYDELLHLWSGWRNETGRQMRANFTRYVKLSNLAVKPLDYRDLGEYWRSNYESNTFESDIRDLLDQINPLYKQVHAFVRRRLREHYGVDKFPATGHIPAHILGDMWAQYWKGIIDIVKPFRNKPDFDVTKELVRQNYTVERMFKTAEEFFFSLGMDKMVPLFWNNSMFVKPNDSRSVVCHASAWDFYDGKDFRTKMCTEINHENLMIVHHEMGHIQYFMHYKNLSVIFRDGANAGFHEAIGDVMSLSVQTPEHLHKIGLLPTDSYGEEEDINFLMQIALEKVVFLPYGYAVDMWRWSVFRGITTPASYNRDWWDLRCRFQGIFPPILRTAEDLDAAAKFHVAANVPFIRYVVSYIIQFQFFKAACAASGHTGPLHKCDIYNNTEAGHLFRKVMELGSSQPWPEVLKLMTNQTKMDAGSLLEYFKPLFDYLKKENGDDVGWDTFCPSQEDIGKGGFNYIGNQNTVSPLAEVKCHDNSGRMTPGSWLITLMVIFLVRTVGS